MTEENVNVIHSHSVEIIQPIVTERGRGKKMGGRVNSLIA